MHKSKINKISLAVCLAFMPIYGFAAGLGKLSVDSGLGEPLKAQIDLISVTPDELSSLSASIASEEAYAMQGIPRLGIHSSIKVEIAKNKDGSPVLKLRSQQPIDDPYLDMLIQVDWSSGRLLREYTILLDPPGYKQAINDSPLSKSVFNPAYVPSESNTAPTAAATATADAYEVKPRLVDKEKRKKKTADATVNTEANVQKETAVTVSEVDELLTKRGDTLHSIAKEAQIDGVSLDQMLVGLFNANKNAFVDGNMNRLKVGQIVKIPSKEDLTAISQQQAAKEIKVHSANWNAYRNSLAGNVLAAEVAEDTDSKQSASGKIVSAQDQAAPIKSGPQDVVKLSAGGKVAAQNSGKASAEADAKILALQEEATAREKALKEAQERTASLESQVADMQKLLALKSQTLADVQKNAETANKTTDTQKPAIAETPPPAGEPVKAEPVKTEPVAQAAVPAVSPEPTSAEKQKPVEAPKSPVVQAPVQPLPEEEPSFLASLLESVNIFMLAGAGVLTLLGAGWVYMRNKRRKDLDSFERGILTSGGLRANTVFGNTTGNATSSADTSFLTDFAQSADGGMIDTNDVDPIAEAEVYMAYGRDAQAEEILKDAISKEPSRYELHLKLLEMYAARKDASAFETIAGELYTILGADDPVWAQVAALGATVEPDNPLYDTSGIVPAVSATSADTRKAAVASADIANDLDFSFDKPNSSTADAPVSEMQSALSAETTIDQSISFEGKPQAGQLEQNAIDSSIQNESAAVPILDFSTADSSVAVPEAKPAADNSMDFDFPNIGSFALNADEAANAAEKTDTSAVNTAGVESMPTFEMPASTGPEEIQFAAPTPAEESGALAGFDFNFTAEPTEQPEKIDASAQLNATAATSESSDFSFEGFANTAGAAEEEKTESSALDAMDFNFEGFGTDAKEETSTEASSAEANEKNTQTSAIEGISLDFEAAAPMTADAENKVEEISFDFPLVEEPDTQVLDDTATIETPAQASNFDFSGISLDLSDVESQAVEPETSQAAAVVADAAPAAASAVQNENPDVDIKLDLVKVYIDMEDIEGARDLLDEVLKEGGPQQRIKAESLLASLA